MTTEMPSPQQEDRSRKRELKSRVEAMSWGAFFVWVGVTLLFEVQLGIGLLGIGAITLGTQAIQSSMGLPVEGFWVAMGLCFLLGGVWEQFAIELPLVPILLIALGVIVFLKGGRVRRHEN